MDFCAGIGPKVAVGGLEVEDVGPHRRWGCERGLEGVRVIENHPFRILGTRRPGDPNR